MTIFYAIVSQYASKSRKPPSYSLYQFHSNVGTVCSNNYLSPAKIYTYRSASDDRDFEINVEKLNDLNVYSTLQWVRFWVVQMSPGILFLVSLVVVWPWLSSLLIWVSIMNEGTLCFRDYGLAWPSSTISWTFRWMIVLLVMVLLRDRNVEPDIRYRFILLSSYN